MDISQLSVSYQRAKAAAHIAMTQKKQVVKFDDCGLFRLLYMVKDKEILKEMETECLAALEEYDRRYHAGYVETLQSYLKHNGSMQQNCIRIAIRCCTVSEISGKFWEMS